MRVLLSNSNCSDEHILLQALGGQLKVKDFICKKCNDASGSNWDSKLVKQLESFVVLLQVNRENKKEKRKVFNTDSGKKLEISSSGKITEPYNYSEVLTNNEKKVTAGPIKIRKEAKKKRKEMLKKYPNSNLNITENL